MDRYHELRQDLRRHPRTWLVTGVAGFIGSSLLETLLDLGQTVVGLDSFATGFRRNLDEVLRGRTHGGGSFRLVEGDVRNPETCRAACEGVDFVLHQAALASVPRSIDDPLQTHEVNVDGTVALFLAARHAGVRRVVYASSSAVYGSAARLPVRERDAGRPLSPYALTKWMDEEYAALFRGMWGLDAVGLRYFNVYGPRQDPRGAYAAVIPQWTRALLAGEPCRVYGDGESTRDFVWVGDVVQANLLAAAVPLEKGAPRVFNVGGGGRVSLEELHAALSDAVGRLDAWREPAACVYEDARPGDVRHSQADLSRIRRVLGYAPRAELGAALAELVADTAARHALGRPLARSA
jgi:UDP-N-acetylglucosamine 4-epimerase